MNFEVEYVTDECPHKHDLALSVPNEFMLLPSNVLVVAVFRLASQFLLPGFSADTVNEFTSSSNVYLCGTSSFLGMTALKRLTCT